MSSLKLGLQLGYWGAQPPPDFVGMAQEAERLGFDSVWTAESWGNDCFTPLAWVGAHTRPVFALEPRSHSSLRVRRRPARWRRWRWITCPVDA